MWSIEEDKILLEDPWGEIKRLVVCACGGMEKANEAIFFQKRPIVVCKCSLALQEESKKRFFFAFHVSRLFGLLLCACAHGHPVSLCTSIANLFISARCCPRCKTCRCKICCTLGSYCARFVCTSSKDISSLNLSTGKTKKSEHALVVVVDREFFSHLTFFSPPDLRKRRKLVVVECVE